MSQLLVTWMSKYWVISIMVPILFAIMALASLLFIVPHLIDFILFQKTRISIPLDGTLCLAGAVAFLAIFILPIA